MSTASALIWPRPGARGARVRPERRLLRRDPAGPGAEPRQADRRALGHRSRRLSAGGLSAPVPGMERPFRDGVRRFWKGDAGLTRDLAARLLGSAERFDHSGRAATSSVNFITSHDGFTLEDLVSFTIKRNFANGEDNRDGHHENHSDNMGVEGPTKDAKVLAARALAQAEPAGDAVAVAGRADAAGRGRDRPQPGRQQQRLCPGQRHQLDRLGRSRSALVAFVERLTALRRALPVLRQRRFLHARPALGRPAGRDLAPARWLGAQAEEWHDPAFRCLCVELRMAAEGGDPPRGGACRVQHRPGRAAASCPTPRRAGSLMLDTTRPDLHRRAPRPCTEAPAQSVLLFRSQDRPDPTEEP
jgi:isoamylase